MLFYVRTTPSGAILTTNLINFIVCLALALQKQ